MSAFINPLTQFSSCWFFRRICSCIILTRHFICKGGECDEKQRTERRISSIWSLQCSVLLSLRILNITKEGHICLGLGESNHPSPPSSPLCQTTVQMQPATLAEVSRPSICFPLPAAKRSLALTPIRAQFREEFSRKEDGFEEETERTARYGFGISSKHTHGGMLMWIRPRAQLN